ncbi:hypothetical protein [Streptomyces ipomoeae]|uniref:hypothetical protein n=1 Tax=Streptomyces ipomoeae TaxID=103232 RepID=UPI0029A6F6EE|nr:hypothetical protein [Streptomyces ipomoeae]MDX2697578.1 hypothetical protein [Streptomyces ipomoeae]
MTPADNLRRAAQTLIDLADETDEETKTNPYWHSQITDEPHWYANGVENALGRPAGKLAQLLNPHAARQLATVFRAWARIADLDPDLLNRVGGGETIDLARAILGPQEQP